LESTGAVSWLSETALDPDEPPQATRNVDIRQRQTMPADACVNRFRAKAKVLEKQQTCEERCFIREYTVDSIKQSADRLFTV
jgi:hypothetical protein